MEIMKDKKLCNKCKRPVNKTAPFCPFCGFNFRIHRENMVLCILIGLIVIFSILFYFLKGA